MAGRRRSSKLKFGRKGRVFRLFSEDSENPMKFWLLIFHTLSKKKKNFVDLIYILNKTSLFVGTISSKIVAKILAENILPLIIRKRSTNINFVEKIINGRRILMFSSTEMI